MSLIKNLTVGGKSLIGDIVTAILFMGLMIISAFISNVPASELMNQRPSLFFFVMTLALLINLFLKGWVLRNLWRWS